MHPSHFDYVTVEDLERIGMGRPAARRLLEAIKKYKGTIKKQKIIGKLTGNRTSIRKRPQTTIGPASTDSLFTCLIKEKVSYLLHVQVCILTQFMFEFCSNI